MPFIISFFVLVLTIGFPRIYGTEIPMAILLVPFYLAKFLQEMLDRGYFSFGFIGLFLLWLLGGTLCFIKGGGSASDLMFHFVISSKLVLNLFFGFVVFRVIKSCPSALLWWLLFQLTVAVCSILSSDLYAILLGFISPRSAEVFQYVINLRALGFGLYHVDGALQLVVALFFYMLISQGGALKNMLFVLMLPISMAMARSSSIPFVIFGALKRGAWLKIVLLFAVFILIVLSFLVSSGPLYEATEIFRNFIEVGKFQSVSVNGLANMYIVPDSVDVYLFGDGKYFSDDTETLGFHMGTDVGYLRLLYFSGAWYVLTFFLLNTYYLFPLMFSKKYRGFSDVKGFALSLMLVFFVVNFKGLQLMPIFGLAFYFYIMDLKKANSNSAFAPPVSGALKPS